MHPIQGDNFLPVDLIRTVAIVLVILLHASTEPYTKIELMSPQGVQIWWASNIYDSIATSMHSVVCYVGGCTFAPTKQV